MDEEGMADFFIDQGIFDGFDGGWSSDNEPPRVMTEGVCAGQG